MATRGPILVLDSARPIEVAGEPREPAVTLTVEPGDLILIEARDARRAAQFADLCGGLLPLAAGQARFLDQDWARLPHDLAATLRGRIGRVFGGSGGWVDFLDMPANILLAALHHTSHSADALRIEAAALARRFGLPGLPLGMPADLSPADRRRAACVRALLGRPLLLLLENPVPAQDATLLGSLLTQVEETRTRGGAAVWLTQGDLVWRDRTVPATARLRLLDHGPVPYRLAA